MKFVSKDLALKLKEKGFNRPCFGWYYINIPAGRAEDELILNTSNTRGVAYEDLLHSHNEVLAYYSADRCVDAPTIEQVLEWLREDHYTYIVIEPINYGHRIKYIQKIWKIYKDDLCNYGDNLITFETYDDACIAGIEYVVEHLINKL